jgi:hypothetical protein
LRPILPLRPGLPEHQTHDYKRHGTYDLVCRIQATADVILDKVRRCPEAIAKS